ncbi:MAG: metallophosphoesterase, partial [Parvularculaceae bacterium]
METGDSSDHEPQDDQVEFMKLVERVASLQLEIDYGLGKGDQHSLNLVALNRILKKPLDAKLSRIAADQSISDDNLKKMICSCVCDLQNRKNEKRERIRRETEIQAKMINQEQEARVVSICSDVHLGTKYAKKNDFYHWLESRRADEKVVLLGDILDCWIFSKYDDEEDLAERVIAEWTELCTALSRLHKQGTEIHYIPGNHDAFVFFIEMADLVPWCQKVMERSQEFET